MKLGLNTTITIEQYNYLNCTIQNKNYYNYTRYQSKYFAKWHLH